MKSFVLNILYIILMLISAIANGQKTTPCPECPKYTKFLQAGQKHFANEDFDQALKEFQGAQVAARLCKCKDSQATLWVAKAVEGIKEQKNRAISAAKEAERERDLAIKAKKEAEKAKKELETQYQLTVKAEQSALLLAEEAKLARERAERERARAEEKALEAEATAYSLTARQHFEQAEYNKALRMAEKAYLTKPSNETASVFGRIAYSKEARFFKKRISAGENISCLALSPKLNYLVTGDDQGKVSVYDSDLQKINSFHAHDSKVTAISISPDNKHILTGSLDATAKLWSMDGMLNQVFVGHKFALSSAEFSPTGKYLVTGGDDDYLIMWDIYGKQIMTFGPHKQKGVKVIFSDKGSYLLSFDNQGVIKVWTKNGELKNLLKCPWEVTALSFLEERNRIYIGHGKEVKSILLNDKRIAIKSTESDLEISRNTPGNKGFIDSNKGLYACILNGHDLNIYGFDPLEGRMTLKFESANTKLYTISKNGRQVVTVNGDNDILVWDLQQSQKFQKFKTSSGNILRFSFHPNDNQVFLGDLEGLNVLDLSNSRVQKYPRQKLSFNHCLLPNSNQLVSLDSDSKVRVYGLGKLDSTAFILEPSFSISTCAVSEVNGELILATERALKILNSEFETKATLPMNVDKFSISPDFSKLVYVYLGNLKFFEVKSRNTYRTIDEVLEVSKIVNGKIAVRKKKEIIIYSINSGKKLSQVRLNSEIKLFSLGRRSLIITSGKTVTIADLNGLSFHSLNLDHTVTGIEVSTTGDYIGLSTSSGEFVLLPSLENLSLLSD